eukprot:4912399-Pleurochrysis_carterae.AAC.1
MSNTRPGVPARRQTRESRRSVRASVPAQVRLHGVFLFFWALGARAWVIMHACAALERGVHARWKEKRMRGRGRARERGRKCGRARMRGGSELVEWCASSYTRRSPIG